MYQFCNNRLLDIYIFSSNEVKVVNINIKLRNLISRMARPALCISVAILKAVDYILRSFE